jgi:cytochrome c oxidase cbb3-type subunit 3
MTASNATTAEAGMPDTLHDNANDATHDEEEAQSEARLLTHAYDGIREYDNPLPGWWSAIFIGTIVFSAFYGLYFHVVDWGSTPDERYQAALGGYESKKELRDRAEAANVSEESLKRATENPKLLAQGEAVFKAKCASCHQPDGSGLIGPNLTDLSQIHGETRMDIYKVIQKGVPGTAMLAWGEQLPQTDILAVASFVTSLRGKNLPGKPPEGGRVQKFE